jgi:hypothetical protein
MPVPAPNTASASRSRLFLHVQTDFLFKGVYTVFAMNNATVVPH